MCKWGTDVDVLLAYPRPHTGRTVVPVDACIAPLVQMLNDYGVHTVGCCCGHGKTNGSILYIQDGHQFELKVRNSNMALTQQQAEDIESEMRRLEADPNVTKTELRLFMQWQMPCGHAAGNLLTCDKPPFGCVICNSRKGGK